MEGFRWGCLVAAGIIGWTLVGLVLTIPLALVLPSPAALPIGLLIAATGAYLTLVRPGRRSSTTPVTKGGAASDQPAGQAPDTHDGTSPGSDPRETVHAATPPPNPLALEAALALSRVRRSAAEARPTRARRTVWATRVCGAIAGALATYLVFFTPDSGEVTFAVSLFMIVGGLAIGQNLRMLPSPRLALAGEAFLGLGIGAALAIASLFVIPIVALLLGRTGV